MSDSAIVRALGEFIRYHRLEQNKTQGQLAEEAGINRSTLSAFEHGKRSNTITLIQVLRALDQLHVLESFQVRTQLSPLQLAALEQKKRKRASRTKNQAKKSQSDW